MTRLIALVICSGLALAASGTTQFLLTFFRQPYLYATAQNTLLDPIQWISLGMIALATAGTAQFLLTFLRQPLPDSNLLDPIQWIALGMIALAGLVLLLQPRKLVTHAV